MRNHKKCRFNWNSLHLYKNQVHVLQKRRYCRPGLTFEAQNFQKKKGMSFWIRVM